MGQVIVMSKADIRKGVDRHFTVEDQGNGTYTLTDSTNGKTKEVSEVTYKKSYKLVEGAPPTVDSPYAMQDTPQPEQPQEEYVPPLARVSPDELRDARLMTPVVPLPPDAPDLSKYKGVDICRRKMTNQYYVAVFTPELRYNLQSITDDEHLQGLTVAYFNPAFEWVQRAEIMSYDNLPESFVEQAADAVVLTPTEEVEISGGTKDINLGWNKTTEDRASGGSDMGQPASTGGGISGNPSANNGGDNSGDRAGQPEGGSTGDVVRRDHDGHEGSNDQPTRTPDESGHVAGDQTPPPTVGKASSGWSLIPKGNNPEGMQKPLISSQGEEAVNGNSMRASRESKAEAQPLRVDGEFGIRQSAISSYLQCPEKFYATQEDGYEENSIFTRVGTAVHAVMEDFYNDPQGVDIDERFLARWTEHGDADPQWFAEWGELVKNYYNRVKDTRPKVIALEFEFDLVIDGVRCTGTIDRIDRVDDDTIRLIDYKTNFMAFTDEELQESIQFKFYSFVVQHLKDKLGEFNKVECQYEMLRLGFAQMISYDKEELDQFWVWVKMVRQKMLEGRDRAPRLNKYCGYCERRHKCNLYAEITSGNVTSILTEDTDLDKTADDRETLKALKKVIEGRLSELDDMIKLKIAETGGEVKIGEHVYSMKAGTRFTYNTPSVIQTLALLGKGDLIPKVVNVSSGALKNALKDDKEIMAALEAAKVESMISPSINRKKYKAPKK